jgi:membrane-bound metal-dependent hydrolase YbcI (DUF457 family)
MLTALHALTHVGLSWIVANLSRRPRRDRWFIVLAGTLPDLDGAGLVWSQDAYVLAHRALGHGLLFIVPMLVLTAWRADRRWSSSVLAALSFHLHLLLDLVGTGGLPIRYWWPLDGRGWSYAGHWTLGSWPNFVVMALTLLGVLWVARRNRRLPLSAPGAPGP